MIFSTTEELRRVTTPELSTQADTELSQNGGAPILIIVFVLLLVATIVVLSVVGIICFKKRLSIMGCFKERDNRILGLGKYVFCTVNH